MEGQTMKIEGLTDVYQIEVPTPFAIGPVNVYLIKKENQLLLVDAGVNTNEAWETFLHKLEDIGLSQHQITAIFLTHHHPDHTGFVSRYSDLPLYGHAKLVPWIEKDENFLRRHESHFKAFAVKMGVPESLRTRFPSAESYIKYSGFGRVTQVVHKNEAIPGFEEWDILETLGHAQSHLSLFRKRDGCLIAGDAVLERITSNALMESPYYEGDPVPKPLVQYRETLKKCMNMPIHIILPGHGTPFLFTKNLIARKLRGQERRRAHILTYLSKGLLTTYEIAKALFPDVYLTQLDLVLSEVQGHLDWLEEDGLIYPTLTEQGHVQYRLIKKGEVGT
jgi:glyoxylase-like metal-dependent hydrolase (beta-lactamase superfamily II)